MAEDRSDPSDQVPEADLLEQRTALTPQWLNDTEPAFVGSDFSRDLVDEADRLEQQIAVPGADDDDYPRG